MGLYEEGEYLLDRATASGALLNTVIDNAPIYGLLEHTRILVRNGARFHLLSETARTLCPPS